MTKLRDILSKLWKAKFLRFGAVGAMGFLVDTGVLYLLASKTGLGLYAGRVGSYLAAATTTWALNRAFTFRESATDSLLKEWVRFLLVNLSGGALNYATYAILVAVQPLVLSYPVMGVAAGSIVGLLANFHASKRFVFR